ncbi:MAG: hypothetical protein Q9165_002250 [Trypethelium subeluteriae]
MDSTANNVSMPIAIPDGRISSVDTPSPSPPEQATLTFSEGDAVLSLATAYIFETAYGRTLLSHTSSNDDRAAAATRIMSAILHRQSNDEQYVDSARVIIDKIHGHAVVDSAFGEGPFMIFLMDGERGTREWERNDTEWEHRILQSISEAKILEMGEIGRELIARTEGRELAWGAGEQVDEREEDEEEFRLHLEIHLYLEVRGTEVASMARTLFEAEFPPEYESIDFDAAPGSRSYME